MSKHTCCCEAAEYSICADKTCPNSCDWGPDEYEHDVFWTDRCPVKSLDNQACNSTNSVDKQA